MVGNGREWSGVVWSGREWLGAAGDSLKHFEGFKGPIEGPGMVGSGRERSGAVRKRTRRAGAVGRMVSRRSWPIPDHSMTLSLFWAHGSAGAWSVLKIVTGIDDPLAVCCGRQRVRVERPENSVWNRRPSRCCGRVAALARGAP